VRSPAVPEGHRANTITFPRLVTSKFRIVLVHRPGTSSGLTEIEAWSHVPLPLSPPTEAPTNLAWGARASASFTSRYDSVSEVNDMVVAFSRYSRNRWTSYGSPDSSDWVELDFPRPGRVGRVELYLWGDGGGTRAPKSYAIETWNGSAWTTAEVLSQVPAKPQVSSVNTVRIAPVTTEKLRVVFEHDRPAATGLTELMVWGPE